MIVSRPTAKSVSRIVAAYLTSNKIEVGEIVPLIASIAQSVSEMQLDTGRQPTRQIVGKKIRSTQVASSINDDYLVSFEDGKKYKSLRKHLAARGLTPEQYKLKWGLSHDYPIVCANHSVLRRDVAKSVGLGVRTQAASIAAKARRRAAAAN